MFASFSFAILQRLYCNFRVSRQSNYESSLLRVQDFHLIHCAVMCPMKNNLSYLICLVICLWGLWTILIGFSYLGLDLVQI